MAVKILAADDSATMRKVLETTFAGEAVELETVGSGEAAVERASSSSPDLVIADASMSMDGYEVARAIKSRPATQDVAVIVLASQHHPYDAEKGRAAGVDDHVLKPYDSQVMIDKARDVLTKARARPAGAPAVAAAPSAVAAARPAAAAPAAPARPALPTAARAPGAGRPGTGAPAASPRATVAFGGAQQASPPAQPAKPAARPMLELADDEQSRPTPQPPAPARTPTPAAQKPPARPALPAAAQPVAAQPVAAQPAAQPAARPAATAAVAAATSSNGDMAAKLSDLGLTRDQIEGVLGLSREVIERVVWEVVPDLAEVIIREEIRRLTAS